MGGYSRSPRRRCAPARLAIESITNGRSGPISTQPSTLSSRHLEVSEQTYHRWRQQYGSMQVDDVKRLKELEHQNTRLKRIVADQALDIAALKDVAEGKF
jgi:putative transposase